LFAEQGKEDAGLLVAVAGQGLEPPEHFHAVRLAGLPDPVRLAGVVLDDVIGHGVHPPGHRAAVAVDGRLGHAQFHELVEIGFGDPADVESAHPVGDLLRSDERDLHRHLLVSLHSVSMWSCQRNLTCSGRCEQGPVASMIIESADATSPLP
jgi:hypothetical protein